MVVLVYIGKCILDLVVGVIGLIVLSFIGWAIFGGKSTETWHSPFK